MDKKAFISILSAGIVWGLTSIFVKELSVRGFDAMQLSAIKIWVAALVFVCYVLLTDRRKFKIDINDIWIFASSGFFSMALFNAAYFFVIVNGGASIAVVLLYTSPVFVIIISAFVFQEIINSKIIAAIMLTVTGCVLVAGLVGGEDILSMQVIIVGLASGLLYGLYSIFGKLALRKYSAETMMMYSFVFGMAAVLPMCNFRGAIGLLFYNPGNLIWGIALGLFCAVIPYFLYTYGLQFIDSGKAATIVAIEPVVGALVGMILYQEDHSFGKVIGMLMIISAILLINYNTDH